MMRRVKRGRGTLSVELAEILHRLLCAQIWSLQQQDSIVGAMLMMSYQLITWVTVILLHMQAFSFKFQKWFDEKCFMTLVVVI